VVVLCIPEGSFVALQPNLPTYDLRENCPRCSDDLVFRRRAGVIESPGRKEGCHGAWELAD